MNLPAVPGALAYVNRERWVVDCPNPHCDNALWLPRHFPVFECVGVESCGTRAPVVWPDNAADIERLLLMRPARRNRNWLPGETLHDLLLENMVAGILPAPADQLGWESRVVLAITGDRITHDPLAVDTPSRRLEIGAH